MNQCFPNSRNYKYCCGNKFENFNYRNSENIKDYLDDNEFKNITNLNNNYSAKNIFKDNYKNDIDEKYKLYRFDNHNKNFNNTIHISHNKNINNYNNDNNYNFNNFSLEKNNYIDNCNKKENNKSYQNLNIINDNHLLCQKTADFINESCIEPINKMFYELKTKIDKIYTKIGNIDLLSNQINKQSKMIDNLYNKCTELRKQLIYNTDNIKSIFGILKNKDFEINDVNNVSEKETNIKNKTPLQNSQNDNNNLKNKNKKANNIFRKLDNYNLQIKSLNDSDNKEVNNNIFENRNNNRYNSQSKIKEKMKKKRYINNNEDCSNINFYKNKRSNLTYNRGDNTVKNVTYEIFKENSTNNINSNCNFSCNFFKNTQDPIKVFKSQIEKGNIQIMFYLENNGTISWPKNTYLKCMDNNFPLIFDPVLINNGLRVEPKGYETVKVTVKINQSINIEPGNHYSVKGILFHKNYGQIGNSHGKVQIDVYEDFSSLISKK